MEEEPIMCKRNLRLLVSLCTIVTFAFSQDVTFTLQTNGNLDYESTADIYGFQFNHDGCATSAAGGDAVTLGGFTVTGSATTVIGFSFSGSFLSPGSGTFIEGVNCTVDQISGMTVAGDGGAALTADLLQGEELPQPLG